MTGAMVLAKLDNEVGPEIDLNLYNLCYQGQEICRTEKLQTQIMYRAKEIFPVICKINNEKKHVELCVENVDIEVQAFVFEDNDKPKSFWMLNSAFYARQEVAKFPDKCIEWSRLQVDVWFQWATAHFKLSENDSLKIWDCDGMELCSIDPKIFESETFRNHLKILCQFNFVCSEIKCLDSLAKQYTNAVSSFNSIQQVVNQPTTLWEFFLNLLIDKDSRDVIVWCDDKGKFRILNTEKVAELWSQVNQTALLSYKSIHSVIVKGIYKDYLVHVPAENNTYQFLIDIQEALGISPMHLNQLRQKSS